MDKNHVKRAKEIIETISYATIASANKEGKPWNTPVFFIHDRKLNIYWFSDKQNQHSQNVRENENVFIVIYDSTVPEGDGEGVYIQAKAVELNDPEEIRQAGIPETGPGKDAPDDFVGDATRRVYKAIPQQVWMNDAEVRDGIFIRDYRIELPLDELRRLLRPAFTSCWVSLPGHGRRRVPGPGRWPRRR